MLTEKTNDVLQQKEDEDTSIYCPVSLFPNESVRDKILAFFYDNNLECTLK